MKAMNVICNKHRLAFDASRRERKKKLSAVINMHRFSALPGICYYAAHGYSDQDEIDNAMLKRNFGKYRGRYTRDQFIFTD